MKEGEDMDNSVFTDMIESLKELVYDHQDILIPKFGVKDKYKLHASNYDFEMDLNRAGHKLEKCTFQLRDAINKDTVLVRFDLIGRTHPNPPGNYPYADEDIVCPHVHFANYSSGGIAIALPLSDPLVKMNLSNDELLDIIKALKAFLQRINVGNRDDFHYNINEELL